jgi:hypothetical protein
MSLRELCWTARLGQRGVKPKRDDLLPYDEAKQYVRDVTAPATEPPRLGRLSGQLTD